MSDALGMIETRGFVAVVEAADAMVKAARVELSPTRRPEADTRPSSFVEMSPRLKPPPRLALELLSVSVSW